MKYTTVTISGIITQIAKTTNIEGYTEGVLEIFLPDETQMHKWTQKDEEKWIKENNKRMKAICDFMNKNNL